MPREPGRRARILDYIREFVREKGYPPTVREVQRACGLASPHPVQYHLAALQRDGLIDRTPRTPRGMHVSGGGWRGVDVPLLGTIAAGQPIPVPTEETWHSAPQDVVEVPPSLLGGRTQVYALKVQGTSMVDALIDDGDIVLMQHTSDADNGEVVAVWLKNREEATLKRIYYQPGRVRLQPANRQMEPLYADPEDVLVQGRVIGVIRKTKPPSED